MTEPSFSTEPQVPHLAAENAHIQLAIYSRSNPDLLIDTIPYRLGPEYLDEFGPGGGGFEISKLDPKLAANPNLLDYWNTVRVLIDGDLIGRWVILKRNDIVVTDGEDADVRVKVSGPGLRQYFYNAVVYPENGVRVLAPQTRVFSFASINTGVWYEATKWKTPVSNGVIRTGGLQGTAPADWPDAPTTQWIWDRDQRGGDATWAPAGDVYFRRSFTTTDPSTDLELFITADNFFKAYIDGDLVHEENDKSGGAVWSQTFSEKVTVGPGTHVLAVRATNEQYGAFTVTGPGSLAVAMFKQGVAATGVAAQLLFVSANSASWRMLAYPAQAPGFSPGELLKVLMAEAQTRGVRGFSWLSLDATEIYDSEGIAWPRDLEWSFAVGTEYADVVDKIEELMADLWIDPVTLKVKLYQSKGVDRSVGANPVILGRAFNVTNAENEGEADKLKNCLLIGYEGGTFEWRDAAYPSVDTEQTQLKYGRIEGFLNVGSGATRERAEVVATATYSMRAVPQESTTVEIVSLSGHVPWRDFQIGDWVLAPNNDGDLIKRRVMSIAASEDDDNGQVRYACEFDSVITDKTTRIERWVANTADGTLGGTVANASGRVQLKELVGGVNTGTSGTGGSSGGGAVPASYTHQQDTPASSWTVNHGLGRYYPTVTVFVGGVRVNADIVYNTLNSLTINFTSAQTGTAVLT